MLEQYLNKVIQGDCLEVMKGIPENSVDSIVTDPPAGISFMGKEWDTFDKNMFGKMNDEGINDLKVKKNFEILPRYSNSDLQGFQNFIYKVFVEAKRVLKPGGHALIWAIPRTSHHTAMGLERAGFEIRDCVYHIFGSGFPKSLNIGKQEGCEGWNGWGTALKPAVECWWLIRKPLSKKNIAENILKWGVGAINIDGNRVKIIDEKIPSTGKASKGRFPSHIIHDGSEEVLKEFPNTKSGYNPNAKSKQYRGGSFGGGLVPGNYESGFGDSGSASRFFYCAKPSNSERGEYNNHPTVKAQALMTYLIKLITPPKGIVLDMFAGSGSTLLAAKNIGNPFIGIEKEVDYVKIALKRLDSGQGKLSI